MRKLWDQYRLMAHFRKKFWVIGMKGISFEICRLMNGEDFNYVNSCSQDSSSNWRNPKQFENFRNRNNKQHLESIRLVLPSISSLHSGKLLWEKEIRKKHKAKTWEDWENKNGIFFVIRWHRCQAYWSFDSGNYQNFVLKVIHLLFFLIFLN